MPVPRYRIEEELHSGRLEAVLPALPVAVLYPQSRRLLPRVRVCVEWIEEVFAQLTQP